MCFMQAKFILDEVSLVLPFPYCFVNVLFVSNWRKSSMRVGPVSVSPAVITILGIQ